MVSSSTPSHLSASRARDFSLVEFARGGGAALNMLSPTAPRWSRDDRISGRSLAVRRSGIPRQEERESWLWFLPLSRPHIWRRHTNPRIRTLPPPPSLRGTDRR